jgi:hypothetical protein
MWTLTADRQTGITAAAAQQPLAFGGLRLLL